MCFKIQVPDYIQLVRSCNKYRKYFFSLNLKVDWGLNLNPYFFLIIFKKVLVSRLFYATGCAILSDFDKSMENPIVGN